MYLYSQVCVKDSNDIVVDSDVSLEIPPGTVIAYSVLELEIKKNGDYRKFVWLCLLVWSVFVTEKNLTSTFVNVFTKL